MSLYDEIAMLWGIIILVICVSFYMVGWLCYHLGYRNGENDMAKRIQRRAEREVQRGNLRRIAR